MVTRPTIDEIRAVGDFAQAYRWYLSFAAFPSAMTAPPTPQDINIRCETVTPPKLTGTIGEIEIRGQKIRRVEKGEYEGTFTLTFYETVDNVIKDFFRQWRELVWEVKTGKQVPKSEYEALILLTQLDNNDNPIWEDKIVGAIYNEGSNVDTLDAVTGEVKPTLILNYDYFEERSLI